MSAPQKTPELAKDQSPGHELGASAGSALVIRKAESAIDELTGDIIDQRISGVRATYTQDLIAGYCEIKRANRRVAEEMDALWGVVESCRKMQACIEDERTDFAELFRWVNTFKAQLDALKKDSAEQQKEQTVW